MVLKPRFHPRRVPGLALWLRADRGAQAALADGQPVAAWEDLGPFGRHATQASAALRPTLQTRTYRGYSFRVLAFDGVDDGLLTGLTLASAPYSVFVCYAKTDATTNFRRVLQGTNNWAIGTSGTAHVFFENGVTGQGGTWTEDTFVVVSFTQATSDARHYLNGVADANNTQTGAPGTLAIADEGLAADTFQGDIAEVLVYDHVLPADQRMAVERYLMASYGILGADLGYAPSLDFSDPRNSQYAGIL